MALDIESCGFIGLRAGSCMDVNVNYVCYISRQDGSTVGLGMRFNSSGISSQLTEVPTREASLG